MLKQEWPEMAQPLQSDWTIEGESMLPRFQKSLPSNLWHKALLYKCPFRIGVSCTGNDELDWTEYVIVATNNTETEMTVFLARKDGSPIGGLDDPGVEITQLRTKWINHDLALKKLLKAGFFIRHYSSFLELCLRHDAKPIPNSCIHTPTLNP